jgi:flavin-dependent dehydrogenase
MYDVIVVGARCAGSPVAMLLAERGARVLLLDRARFPSDIPHGHFIHRQGPRRLKEWGLLDRVAAACVPIEEQLVDLGDFPLVTRDLSIDGVAWGYAPRRAVLDKILVDAAVERGAELREGFTVDGFVVEGNRVVGVRGRTRSGATVEERAQLTIGADGRNSKLARTVHAPAYDATPTLLCYYFSYWSGVESLPFEMYARPDQRRTIFAFRPSPGSFGVFVGRPIEDLPAIKADVEGEFMATLELVPDFAERIRAGRREERFLGATDLPNFYRKPWGPGWALVGDAGCHKDPYMALGIADALRDAQHLADAVTAGFAGTRAMEAALDEYEQRRNRESAREYQQNLAAARFVPPPPSFMELRAQARHDPQAATRLAMVRFGMIDAAPSPA